MAAWLQLPARWGLGEQDVGEAGRVGGRNVRVSSRDRRPGLTRPADPSDNAGCRPTLPTELRCGLGEAGRPRGDPLVDSRTAGRAPRGRGRGQAGKGLCIRPGGTRYTAGNVPVDQVWRGRGCWGAEQRLELLGLLAAHSPLVCAAGGGAEATPTKEQGWGLRLPGKPEVELAGWGPQETRKRDGGRGGGSSRSALVQRL